MTTERVLPAISVPLPGRPEVPPVRSAGSVATRASVARFGDAVGVAAEVRARALMTTPARAGMLVGATAALYAVSLAAVAGLQSASDAELAAMRQPYLDQVAASRASNDALETRVREADAAARALADSYGTTLEDVADFQARLDSLAQLVADVEGSAAALPDRIRLPAVGTRGPIASSRSGSGSRPATTTRSGASGG